MNHAEPRQFHQRIMEKARNRATPPVSIVTLGNSVTQGIDAVDQLPHSDVYHHQLKELMGKRYPLKTFSVLNAGLGGQAVVDGLSRDVIPYQPDLTLQAFRFRNAVRWKVVRGSLAQWK